MDPAGIDAKGEVRVNGVPLRVDLRENMTPGQGRQADAQGRGRAGRRRRQGVGLATGPTRSAAPIGFDASLVEARSPLRTIDVALDLRRASIHVPAVVLTKQAGQPGTVSARLVQPDERSLKIEQVKAEVAGWSVDGDAELDLAPTRSIASC